MSSVIIRHLIPKDRSQFLKIGAETAYFGEPIEAYFDDRNLFLDVFYSYYTDFDPSYSWVATSNDSVIGLLAGSKDTKEHKKGIQKNIIPMVFGKWIRGRYKIKSKTWLYLIGLVWSEIKTRSKPIELDKFPAHLHINIYPEWRNQGLGRALMERYLDQLLEERVPGVHLNTTSQNSAAIKLYEKMGFQLFSIHLNWFWSKWFGDLVNDLCFTKALA